MAFDANDLSPHEHFVVDRTSAGEIADFSAMGGPGGAKPAVRAGFLRKLLLRLDASWAIRTPGVRIKGARIEGVLDLTDCSGEGLPALSLTECEIPELVDLSHARLARLSLNGSRLTRLIAVEVQIDGELDLCDVAPIEAGGRETFTAKLRGARIDGDVLARGAKFARPADSKDDALNLQGAEIEGNVFLREGFDAFGPVTLYGARIKGSLDCSGGAFLNRSDDASASALIAETARIEGDALLRAQFKAEGEVWFMGATISGNLDISEASFRNEFGYALMLANAEIEGQLKGDGVKIAGQLTLQNTSIAHNLDLRGAEIVHRSTPRGETFGRAVDAASVRVEGGALLQGANIKGELFLADARISGYLAFGGGRYINPGQWAIRAPNARVGSNLTFTLPENGFAPHGQKTVVEGGCKLARVRIGGKLAWSAFELRGPGPDRAKGGVFSFTDANVDGAIEAAALTTQQETLIDASGASCAALDDDVKTGWGAETVRLGLDGFAYGRIDSQSEHWRTRLAWLKRSRREGEKFSPQPFTHAAATYARMGRREDARRIQLAQHDLHTLSGAAGPFTWALSSLFGMIAGYGLAPIRVVRALVIFLALGVFGVLAMNEQGALVTPQGRACNGAVEPTLYALDVALPVIDLGQEGRCAPGRTARAELPQGMAVSETNDWRLFEGVALWRWAHALYAMLGAILTGLAIVTFSGIMKPKDE
ncbi:hypothetical protein [Candidatus Viadribacter manganicus]|uniref:Membrane-associated oxidoreductase n=1 Tax=Candidatus Viadribacter manganicus TaxID=1759059 RepID=A0A1B1AEU3_9PROT|nr:hypothetical protein [Candidatus Viadribacter manganicus]ANP45088.1 hypothetical protein ATE48_03710 [Candidatus Viadribacter manganicus]